MKSKSTYSLILRTSNFLVAVHSDYHNIWVCQYQYALFLYGYHWYFGGQYLLKKGENIAMFLSNTCKVHIYKQVCKYSFLNFFFIYLTGRVERRQKQRERGALCPLIYSTNSLKASTEPGWSQEQEVSSVSPTWVQGPQHLVHLPCFPSNVRGS